MKVYINTIYLKLNDVREGWRFLLLSISFLGFRIFEILLGEVENNFFKNSKIYILLYIMIDLKLKLSIEYTIYNNNRIW